MHLRLLSLVALTAVTFASHAAEPFDWTKAAMGDITREFAANINGDVVTVGKGKIHLNKAAKVTKAAVDHVKLSLTITISEPEQSLRFEDLAGTFGGYLPNGAALRGVKIEQSPHTEKFLRAGVLTLDIPNPNRPQGSGFKIPSREELDRDRPPYQAFPVPGQSVPPKVAQPAATPLLPGPNSGYKPRSQEFAELAAALSGKYVMPGRNTLRPYEQQWQEAAAAAAKHPVPEIRKRGEKMLAVAKSERNIDLAALRQDLLADAAEAESRKIGYGTLLGYETDAAGNQGRPIFARGNEDDPAGIERARELRALARLSDEKLKAWAVGNQRQNGFGNLLFGYGMTNHPDELFKNLVFDARPILVADAKKNAGAKSNAPLVEVLRPDSATIKVRNAGDKTLSDALVLLDCGFTKTEKPKRFGAPIMLFVPQWKAKEELELQFDFKDPTVMHARVATYATEASREGDEFTLPEPKKAVAGKQPNPKAPVAPGTPGVVVLRAHRPLATGSQAWAVLDGKRIDWRVGEQTLELPVAAGEHKLVLQCKMPAATIKVYDKTVKVADGERVEIPVLVK